MLTEMTYAYTELYVYSIGPVTKLFSKLSQIDSVLKITM